MNTKNAKNLFKNIGRGLSKHSPEILTGLGIAGMITAGVLAVKSTPKAMQLIEEAKENREDETCELSKKEVVQATWKCYIPSVVTAVCAAGCLIGAQSVNSRRTAALATAYKISETALAEFSNKAIETVGEEKVKEIKDKIAKDKVEKNPVSKSTVIVTDGGSITCYDVISGRYFKSDMNTIERAANELNRRMVTDICGYVSLNEFYDELGLEHIKPGDDLGWNAISGLIDVAFSSQISDDGTPCIVVDYRVAPQYNYDM